MRHWRIQNFETIDSTNLEAKRQARAEIFENSWIVADAQTAGRGRIARKWVSEPGNLYTTALFHEPGGLATAMRLPFATALAVRDTIVSVSPNIDARLKWPNDVRVAHQKMCGILIETGQAGDNAWVAVGVGINLISSPDVPDKPATCGFALDGNAEWGRDSVLGTLMAKFEIRLAQAREGFESVRKDWLKHAEGLGETVSVNTPQGALEGVFEDMDSTGGLILRLPTGERRLISSGDVNLIGMA